MMAAVFKVTWQLAISFPWSNNCLFEFELLTTATLEQYILALI